MKYYYIIQNREFRTLMQNDAPKQTFPAYFTDADGNSTEDEGYIIVTGKPKAIHLEFQKLNPSMEFLDVDCVPTPTALFRDRALIPALTAAHRAVEAPQPLTFAWQLKKAVDHENSL